MDYLQKIMVDFELHSVEGIRECFESGINPNQLINGKPLINELINMYTRGLEFKACIQVFVDYGLKFEDRVLLAVLLDDAVSLDVHLNDDKDALGKKYTYQSTFTPLHEVSLLHICSEYNHLACAKILVKYGADINSKAGTDNFGFGGHTPIFHTVNQDANKSIDMMKYLISQNAELGLTVSGLIWGKGYEWETFIPSVNPLSYAMMGLLRQFQRSEQDIYKVISLLYKAKYNIDYFPPNIPNKYLYK
ncbi:MAG: ankyrin repeat domain-containing protein [Saprospiraceae bacterium]|nr:ankyrin repeat domain-containing protein [Saprospiraceae bacterium]